MSLAADAIKLRAAHLLVSCRLKLDLNFAGIGPGRVGAIEWPIGQRITGGRGREQRRRDRRQL
jgi:hypothetical protein